MDGYQFIAALVGSAVTLGWPVAAVVLGITFRKPFLALLAKVTTLKAAGFEMTVAERSAEAVEELASPRADPEPTEPAPSPKDDPADDAQAPSTGFDTSPSVNVSAEGYVLRAWKKLEAALRRATGTPETVEPVTRMVDRLSAEGKLPGSLPSAIWQLRKIRNDVVHGRASVSMIDAMTFDAAVQNVLQALPSEQRESVPDVAVSILHQGEAATMNMNDIKRELERQSDED